MAGEARENTTTITRQDLAMSMRARKRRTRARRVATDNFGRKYLYWEDLNSGSPVGLVERLYVPQVGLDIPDQFLRFDPDRPWRVMVDLKGWVRSLREALRAWLQSGREQMIRLYKEKGAEAVDERGEDAFTGQVKEVIGPKPLDWRLVALMARGDLWTLGLQRQRTPAVVSIIGKEKKVPKAQRGLGFDLDEDFRLDPELEALAREGGSVRTGYEDENDEEDALRALNQKPVGDDDDEEEEEDETSGSLGGSELTGEDETDGEGDLGGLGDDEGDEGLSDLDGFDDEDDEEEPLVRQPAAGKRTPRMRRSDQ